MGADAVKKAVIVRSLYCLKSAEADFLKHLSDYMKNVGYKPCPADPDMWIKPKVDIYGDRYYSYIFFYADDILLVHHDAITMINKIDKYFKLKPQ